MYNPSIYVRDVVQELIENTGNVTSLSELCRIGIMKFKKQHYYTISSYVISERNQLRINVKELSNRPYVKKVHLKMTEKYREYFEEIFNKYFYGKIVKSDTLLAMILIALLNNKYILQKILHKNINNMMTIFQALFTSPEQVREYWKYFLKLLVSEREVEELQEIERTLRRKKQSFWEKEFT